MKIKGAVISGWVGKVSPFFVSNMLTNSWYLVGIIEVVGRHAEGTEIRSELMASDSPRRQSEPQRSSGPWLGFGR